MHKISFFAVWYLKGDKECWGPTLLGCRFMAVQLDKKPSIHFNGGTFWCGTVSKAFCKSK